MKQTIKITLEHSIIPTGPPASSWSCSHPVLPLRLLPPPVRGSFASPPVSALLLSPLLLQHSAGCRTPWLRSLLAGAPAPFCRSHPPQRAPAAPLVRQHLALLVAHRWLQAARCCRSGSSRSRPGEGVSTGQRPPRRWRGVSQCHGRHHRRSRRRRSRQAGAWEAAEMKAVATTGARGRGGGSAADMERSKASKH